MVVFTVGTVLMRSAGCAFNDWADRDYDAHVKRTADRPLARGEIAPWEALVVGGLLALLAFFMVVMSTNRTTVLLSVAALVIAIAYPFCKRFLALPQAFLGIAFSFGIPMAFAAVLGYVSEFGWWLFAFNLVWVIAYDTEYAMVDRDDDLRIGIRTSAITFGRFDVLAVGVCYAIFLVRRGLAHGAHSARPALLGGLRLCRAARDLPPLAHPHARARALLSRIPQQSLAGLCDLRRDRGRPGVAAEGVAAPRMIANLARDRGGLRLRAGHDPRPRAIARARKRELRIGGSGRDDHGTAISSPGDATRSR